MVAIDLQTTNIYIFGISVQFATKKSTGQLQILTFIWEFSIFKASGLPRNLKKNRYAEIIFIFCYNFLRVRRDQFLPNCNKIHHTNTKHLQNSFLNTILLAVYLKICKKKVWFLVKQMSAELQKFVKHFPERIETFFSHFTVSINLQ
jgi:hypothetical protein